MYEPYSEEVLTRTLDPLMAYDGRFLTQRFHVGNNCKCQNNLMHPGHHQTPYLFEPDPPGNGGTEESVDLAEARQASHVKHKHRGD